MNLKEEINENDRKFIISFVDWCKQEYELEDTSHHNKWVDVEDGEYKTSEELFELFLKQN